MRKIAVPDIVHDLSAELDAKSALLDTALAACERLTAHVSELSDRVEAALDGKTWRDLR